MNCTDTHVVSSSSGHCANDAAAEAVSAADAEDGNGQSKYTVLLSFHSSVWFFFLGGPIHRNYISD